MVVQELGQPHGAAAPLPGTAWGVAAPAGQRRARQATAGQAEPVAVAGLAWGIGPIKGGAVAEGPLQQLLRAGAGPGLRGGLGAGC